MKFRILKNMEKRKSIAFSGSVECLICHCLLWIIAGKFFSRLNCVTTATTAKQVEYRCLKAFVKRSRNCYANCIERRISRPFSVRVSNSKLCENRFYSKSTRQVTAGILRRSGLRASGCPESEDRPLRSSNPWLCISRCHDQELCKEFRLTDRRISTGHSNSEVVSGHSGT